MTTVQLAKNNIEQLSTRLSLAMWNNHIVKCQTLYANKMTTIDSANVFDRLRTIDVFNYSAIQITPIVLQHYLDHFCIVEHLLSTRAQLMDQYMLSEHCPYSVREAMYRVTIGALSSVANRYDRLFADIHSSLNL